MHDKNDWSIARPYDTEESAILCGPMLCLMTLSPRRLSNCDTVERKNADNPIKMPPRFIERIKTVGIRLKKNLKEFDGARTSTGKRPLYH